MLVLSFFIELKSFLHTFPWPGLFLYNIFFLVPFTTTWFVYQQLCLCTSNLSHPPTYADAINASKSLKQCLLKQLCSLNECGQIKYFKFLERLFMLFVIFLVRKLLMPVEQTMTFSVLRYQRQYYQLGSHGLFINHVNHKRSLGLMNCVRFQLCIVLHN